MTTFDLAQVERLLTTTRTVRKRLDLERPVEPEVVTDCLRLALQAPNAANTQLWRWLVVTDADKREQIAAIYRHLFDKYVRAAASGDGGGDGEQREYRSDPETSRMLSSSAYLADNLQRVPVHVIPCYLERPNYEAGNVALSTLYGSVLQAVWSFQLALRSRGLASAWTTMHLWSEQEVASILGIPDDVTQVALIPVAYAIGQDFKPAPRQPVEQVTYWNEWPTAEA